MSEPKFTPGPWKILYNDKTKVVLEQQGVAVFVADTYAGFTKSEEEQEFNAVLISAAPEMYEALQWTCSRCNSDSCKDCPVEKALKKARGEK